MQKFTIQIVSAIGFIDIKLPYFLHAVPAWRARPAFIHNKQSQLIKKMTFSLKQKNKLVLKGVKQFNNPSSVNLN